MRITTKILLLLHRCITATTTRLPIMYVTLDDIKNSSSETTFFGFIPVKSITFNFYKLYKNLSFERLKNSVVRKVNSDLSTIYIQAKGLNLLANEGKVEFTIENHELVNQFLTRFRKMYYKLESINFFEESGIKNLSDDTLTELYRVERNFRYKAYENMESKGHDKDLIDFASRVSLNTAANYNAST